MKHLVGLVILSKTIINRNLLKMIPIQEEERGKELKRIRKRINIPLNLEMAPTKEMLKIAIKYNLNQLSCCLNIFAY